MNQRVYEDKRGQPCPICSELITTKNAKTCGSKECWIALRNQTNKGESPPTACAAASEAPKEERQDDVTKDEWKIEMKSSRVKTYEELVAACEVDLEIWEPERFRVKSYEVTYVPRSTRPDDKQGWVRKDTTAITVPMFAISASFVRKSEKKIRSGDKVEFLRQLKDIVKDDAFKFDPLFTAGTVPPITAADPSHHEIACVATSDHHLTETVRPEDANGVNVYNSAICANRLWEHAQKVKSILARHMSLYTIDKIWMPLLGDVVNGTIHEEYVATNDLSDVAAVILGSRLLYMFVQELKSLGLKIDVDAVHGNHARLTPSVPTKRQAHTNLDWQLYEILADKLADDDQVKMDITTAQIGMRKIYDWNYVFEHGINVSASKIEDFEDRVRALLDDPTFRKATGYSGASFDQIVIGNLHKPTFLERTIVNGSYIGQNELGQSWRLKPIKAQQLMWGASRKHVRTWQYAIDVTHVVSDKPENPFSEYACWFLKKHGQ